MSSENLKFRVWDREWKKYREDDIVAGNFFISKEGDLFVWNDHDLIRSEKRTLCCRAEYWTI